jgi:hypothetical protein
MQRIIAAHFNSFVKSFGLESDSESTQFEKFCNYCILSNLFSFGNDLDDVTTGNGDDGTDGIGIIVDEELIISKEEAEQVFSSDRRNHEVEVVFVQSKTSDSFDLGDFLKFKESVLKFVSAEDYSCEDDIQKNCHEIYDIVMSNVPKIRNGKPSIVIRYVTTGIYREPIALESAKSEFLRQISDLSLFQNIDVKFIDRDDLVALWISTYSGTSAKLQMFSHAPLPTIAGINEAYLAVVKAKEFVENLLVTEDGNLRTQVFEENVRSFLGLENSVNYSISQTIRSGEAATRFPVLNNGITIVSPDVRVQGTILHLENFQIVNGCQTSNVLFENRASLDESIMVNLKVVETTNEDVFSELVRATNSQTKVEDTQFFSLRPIVKKIEQYFNTYEGNENRLYFERRDRQYVGVTIPALRIFSVHNAAKSVCAMFLQRPDLSFRYPKAMYAELGDRMFASDVKESMFYASCLTLYRLHLLVSNNTIPTNMRRFKWHIIALVRAIICGKPIPMLNSRKMETDCELIIQKMGQHSEEVVRIFENAVEILSSIDHVTDDLLKRQAIFTEMMEKL